MSDDEPDWELLPDRPAAFFRLEGEYDRRELKRAYTRLIKRYKPERHPEQFRRIRAAYELLDERLRYGTTTTFTTRFAHESPRPAAGERGTDDETPATAHVDAVELLSEHGPDGARSRLRASAKDDPTAWARLALLDDALDADPMAPFRTLLEGIRASRGHTAPVNLLAAFLHEEIDPQIAARVLVDLAKAAGSGAIHGTLFWFLTDFQWTHLVDVVKFDSFASLLDRCAREIGEDGRPAQLVLMLRLRRRAVLRADDDWLATVDRDLVESLRDMPPWAEHDYDAAEWLSAYRHTRPHFVDGSDLRDILDDALSAIVTGDDVNADRAFLLAQDACFERHDELFESFGEGDPVTGSAVNILHWYGDEWREREGIEQDEPRVAYRKAVEFSRRLHRRSQRSLVGRAWNLTLFLLLFGGVGVAFGVAFLLKEVIGPGALVLPVAALIFTIAANQRAWFARPLRWVSGPFQRRQHRVIWRPMTMDFLEESRVPFHMLVGVLQDDETSPNGAPVLEAIAGDHGLALYSNAVRTLG